VPVVTTATVTKPPGGGGGGAGLPPAFGPRRDWQFILGSPAGGYDIPITQATGRTITWRLTDAHDAAFTVNAAAGYDEGIWPLQTDLHVLYGGQPVFRGRIGNTSDSFGDDGHQATFTAAGYRAILERRELYSTSKLAWTTVDVGDIVWGLVTQTQGQPGGDLGIVTGNGFPFGATASKTCTAGDMIAEKIDDLAYIDPGGFDWDITPHDSSQQTLDLWPNARGNSRGVIFQWGDRLTLNGWTRDIDASTYANALRMTGTDPAPPAEVTTTGIADDPAGRFDGAYSTDEADPATLRARGVLQLEAASTLVPAWTIPLRPGAWDGPDHLWIGDTVTVVPASGRFKGMTETLRVLELTAAIGQDAPQVTITAGQPRPDQRRELKRLVRELRKARKTRVAGANLRTHFMVTTAPPPV
jgi:hypothetical protein